MRKRVGYFDGTNPGLLTAVICAGHDTIPIANGLDNHGQHARLINDEFNREQKIHLIEQLWRVAFADQELDRYEEALVRKISELLHVPHRDFIQAKHRVQESEQ